jgi:hypothetical protein
LVLFSGQHRGVIHRREKMTAAGFQKALERSREQVLVVATTGVPKADQT